MPLTNDQITRFLRSVHPYDALPPDALPQLAEDFEVWEVEKEFSVYDLGEKLAGLFIVYEGVIEVRDENDVVVSHLGLRNSFGERGLLRDGTAVTSARAEEHALLLLLPAAKFRALIADHEPARRFFDRSGGARKAKTNDLATSRVDSFMARKPITVAPTFPVGEAARLMREKGISSLCITQNDALSGILTSGDLVGKVLAEARPLTTPVSEVMTSAPISLPPTAIGSDVLHVMMERGIGHVPIVEAGKMIGIVTQTDLTRIQAISSAELVAEVANAATAEDMAKVTARIPQLLVQLVAGGNRHEIVTRLITDIADTATRRLLALAEDTYGPPPVPYLWLACGSQGRQEQTGVSDQDNCLILDDAVTDDMRTGYFAKLAKFVSDGLDVIGYFYCPGDMMATNTRWCQPLSVWRSYFTSWIATPNPEAQMLASVMFDLRPIGGTFDLFADLQNDTFKAAAKNSIFVAHMTGNSLGHQPPLGLLRGLATIRSGEHKNQLDLKHNGVVPIVDLARLYALQGQLAEVNTRARLTEAQSAKVLSETGAADLLDAYDLIAETRLEHQARQIMAGTKPDNFLSPAALSDFERSHLRDAFVVVKSLQSAIGHGKGILS
ncbi:Choline transport ATP-binding protein OpuBA [Shimia sp. SK013]|uniref:DUF294 nucleotidyltransferase-like domain-containing protein n=1 Tax=Shimia sp. SK013 TaxID=1389006 RepID=UPI0006B4FB17|nr:DUF294 nucleotidyltransferase-like domain-containing protein [Shimia sp. SK013]KPA23372.1 Choline transport ATP-binding protein OpuBA [Shimia sp. SK013]